MSEDASVPAVRRRRWPRIVTLLFLLAAIGGFVFWLVKPQTATATALIEVRRDVPSVFADSGAKYFDEYDFEIVKKTQIAVFQSKFLLTSALRDPGIASLSVFAGVRDAEEWLQDHLDLSYPENGEILAISLSGPVSQAHDLQLVVDAVVEAYQKEILGKETARRLYLSDMLSHDLQNINGEIKRKYEDYLAIAKGMGRSDGNKDFQMQLDLKRLERIDDELAQLERAQLRIDSGGDSKDSTFVAARMEQLRKRQNELEENILKRNETSVELETRREELNQLQRIANNISIKVERWHIDWQLPLRIRPLQPATIEPEQLADRKSPKYR